MVLGGLFKYVIPNWSEYGWFGLRFWLIVVAVSCLYPFIPLFFSLFWLIFALRDGIAAFCGLVRKYAVPVSPSRRLVYARGGSQRTAHKFVGAIAHATVFVAGMYGGFWTVVLWCGFGFPRTVNLIFVALLLVALWLHLHMSQVAMTLMLRGRNLPQNQQTVSQLDNTPIPTPAEVAETAARWEDSPLAVRQADAPAVTMAGRDKMTTKRPPRRFSTQWAYEGSLEANVDLACALAELYLERFYVVRDRITGRYQTEAADAYDVRKDTGDLEIAAVYDPSGEGRFSFR
jgi:hypothetical protein